MQDAMLTEMYRCCQSCCQVHTFLLALLAKENLLNATCDINVYDLAIAQRGVTEKSAWTDGCSTTLQLRCIPCLIFTADR